MSMPLHEVLERMSGVIGGSDDLGFAALDASAYQRATDYTDIWSEAAYPFSVEESADSVAHLEYVVLPIVSTATNFTRDGHAMLIELTSRVEVQFAYWLRHTSQVADMRDASAAAMDVCRAIADEANWGTANVNVRVETRFEPRVIPDESWIIVVTSFLIQHEEAL